MHRTNNEQWFLIFNNIFQSVLRSSSGLKFNKKQGLKIQDKKYVDTYVQ